MDGRTRRGDHRRMSDSLAFVDLAATARSAGFELYDSRGLPVDEEMQPYLEDENLTAEEARVSFREPPPGETHGVVADVSVGQQVFRLRGDWSRVAELRHLISGRSAPEERRPDTS